MTKTTMAIFQQGPHTFKLVRDMSISSKPHYTAKFSTNGKYHGDSTDYGPWPDHEDVLESGMHSLRRWAKSTGHDHLPVIPTVKRTFKNLEEGWGNNRDSTEAVKNSILHRLRVTGEDLHLIRKHGITKFMNAVHDAASFHGSGGLDEIGSSDVTAFVNSTKQNLGELKESLIGAGLAAGAIGTAWAANRKRKKNQQKFNSKMDDIQKRADEIGKDIKESSEDYKKNPKWSYEDARGVKKTGYFVGHHQGQGSDVSYFFKDENGTTDVVSGERLKRAKRLWEQDYTKIPKVSNLYEAYAKVYAQNTLGVDVENLEEMVGHAYYKTIIVHTDKNKNEHEKKVDHYKEKAGDNFHSVDHEDTETHHITTIHYKNSSPYQIKTKKHAITKKVRAYETYPEHDDIWDTRPKYTYKEETQLNEFDPIITPLAADAQDTLGVDVEDLEEYNFPKKINYQSKPDIIDKQKQRDKNFFKFLKNSSGSKLKEENLNEFDPIITPLAGAAIGGGLAGLGTLGYMAFSNAIDKRREKLRNRRALKEARTSGTRRDSGRGRITVHNFAKIPTWGRTPEGDVVVGDERAVYDYTQTATLPDGKRSKVRSGDILKKLPGGGKGVMYAGIFPVRITGGEGKGNLERVAGYTGQSSDINKLVGGKDGLKPKHAMRFRQTIGENWDDDRSMMRDIRRSQMSQKDIVDDEYRKADAAFKAYNELKARPSHTRKSREAMDYFSQKYMYHHHKAQVEASKLHPSTYNPYPNGPFEGENR